MGLIKGVVAATAGFYLTKGVTLAVAKPVSNLVSNSAWREPAVAAAGALAAFAGTAAGKATKLLKGDVAQAFLVGGLLASITRGIEKSSVVGGLKAGFAKDLLSDVDDLSDYLLEDGSDGWDGAMDADLAGLGHFGQGGAFLNDYEFEGD